MAYTVTTNPDIGSGSDTGVSNGTYSIPVSGLAYNTTYSWTVEVTDGTNPVSRTFTFTTGSVPVPWWDYAWLYRKKITINSSQVAGNLPGFPVLIDITDAEISANAQASGNDIAFTDSTGNKLSHEIETYDSTTGHLVAWVRTDLSADTDTVVYIYFGNDSASDPQDHEAVWDVNYVMVQHLAEKSGTHFDSTANSNDGSPENGIIQNATGKINGADLFDGVDDGVNCGSRTSLDNLNSFTVEAWIFPDSYGQLNAGRVFDKSQRLLFVDGYDTTRHCLDFQQTFSTTNGLWRTPTNSIQTGQWYHLALVYDSSAATNDPIIYINGVAQTLSEALTPAGTAAGDASEVLLIGRRFSDPGGEFGGYRGFDGAIDELRVSNIMRSEEWITTAYNNQSTAAGFYSVGPGEFTPGNPTVKNPDPANGATGVSPSLTQLSFTLFDPEPAPLDYTVTTDPDIGSGSDTGVSNGIYSIPISGVAYDTTYTWTVIVTDGTYQTIKTFNFTTRPEYYVPTITNINPSDGATDVILNPQLSAHVEDLDGELLDITFSYFTGTSWEVLQTYDDVASGTYTAVTAGHMNSQYTLYRWKITADDQNGHVTEEEFELTTGGLLVEKWGTFLPASGYFGGLMLIDDINRDGVMEIVAPSHGRVTVLRATDGAQLWTYADGAIDGSHALVTDLDNDSYPEIILSLGTGLLALHHDGSQYWRKTNIAGVHNWSRFISFDTDGDGYPTIYVPFSDADGGTGKICSIASDGTVLHMDSILKCCSGGISIADYNFDGSFEIYMGDREEGALGLGLRSWNADDLSRRWNQINLYSSSFTPMIIDVNDDGLLDIVGLNVENKGAGVLSAANGSFMIDDRNAGFPAELQPAVYDIDEDGNLELIVSSDDSRQIVVWDLSRTKKRCDDYSPVHQLLAPNSG